MMEQSLYERVGLKTQPAETRPAQRPARPRVTRPQGSIPPLRRAVALLVQHPELAQLDLPDGWQALDSPGILMLQQLLAALHERPAMHSAALVEHWEDATTRQQLAKLAVLELGILDDAADQFLGTLRTLAAEQRRNDPRGAADEEPLHPAHGRRKQQLRELYRPLPAQSTGEN